jgi:hypothetical protein
MNRRFQRAYPQVGEYFSDKAGDPHQMGLKCPGFLTPIAVLVAKTTDHGERLG